MSAAAEIDRRFIFSCRTGSDNKRIERTDESEIFRIRIPPISSRSLLALLRPSHIGRFIEASIESFFLFRYRNNAQPPGPDELGGDPLKGKIVAAQGRREIGKRFSRINCRQRLGPRFNHRKETSRRPDLSAERIQARFVHPWHIHSQGQQMGSAHCRQRCR